MDNFGYIRHLLLINAEKCYYFTLFGTLNCDSIDFFGRYGYDSFT